MKRPPPFESESQLATAFMTHLEQLGWDCYPEVAINRGGNRADLIAYRKPIVWVIEAKLTLNEAVCEQASAWLGWAHIVSVLAPWGRAHPVLEHYCESKGIGIISASREVVIRAGLEAEFIRFDTRVDARLHRSVVDNGRYVVSRLHPDMKRYAPGTNAKFSSPWRRTMEAAIAVIERTPGVGLRDIVAAIKHHYHTEAGARSCLAKWLPRDSRVRVEQAGRALRFFPAAETKNSQERLLA